MYACGWKRNVFYCSILSIVASPVLATGHFYLGASLASSFAKPDGSAPISYYSTNEVTDTYPLNSNGNYSPTLSINGGYEFIAADKLQMIALGLGLYQTLSPYNYKGQLVETTSAGNSDPLSNYQYRTISLRMMAEIQLNWVVNRFIPFINFGLGPSWNKLYGYNETAIVGNGSNLPPFQSMLNQHVAYQAGIGIASAFNWSKQPLEYAHERVAVGYRFVNFGTTSFGNRGPDYPFPLNTRALKANDIYINYTHLF